MNIENLFCAESVKGISIMRLIFIRHGSKNQDGELSLQGKKEASEYFQRFFKENIPPGGVKVYHSGIRRAEETAEIISNSLEENGYKIRKISDLSEFPFTDEEITRLDIGNGKWLREEKPSEALPSTNVTVVRMANIVKHFIDLSKRLDTRSRQAIICVSHVPPIMLFLKKAVGEKIHSGEDDIVNKLGGFTKPLHGFEIVISRTNGSIDLKLILEKHVEDDLFDKVEFRLSEEELDKLCKLK